MVMRIAQVTAVYPPYAGGIGHVAEEYSNRLSQSGEAVEVFTVDYQKQIPQLQDVGGVIVNRLSGIVSYGNAAILPELVWKLRGFDIIHLHYPFYGGAIFAYLASIIWRKPLVVTYHMKTKASGWLGICFKLQRLFIEPFILHRARVVLVSSLDYAQSARLKPSKLVALPFGVDVERFSPSDKPAVRRKLKMPEDEMIFLFVGGLDDAHYFKGVDVLIRACAKVSKDHAWRLIIVGSGNLLSTYEQLVEEFGLAGRVEFRGKVANADLPNYFRAADVHLLPSIDRSEAYGLVTLEAAASGTASIVSDLPGVRTLVVHQRTGLHVKPGNEHALAVALEWVLQHKEKVKFFGENARARILEEYSAVQCISRLQELYSWVISGGKSK
ncbi:MAG: glycosyltransferase family 4 protein [Candidatus Uhrbacteria bacterium]|nr:glycosyltransferase family 4 protein [Candidatus Uhrbacteria bacterium]